MMMMMIQHSNANRVFNGFYNGKCGTKKIGDPSKMHEPLLPSAAAGLAAAIAQQRESSP